MTDWQGIFLSLGVKVNQPISGVCVDTRTLQPGEAFIAINSGDQYIDEALKAQASCVITQQSLNLPKVYTVKDTVGFLGQLANAHRQALSAVVIGVTGSVGKTSLVQILLQMLQKYGDTVATDGNQNNAIGVALTLLRATQLTKYLVVEMGISQPGDMDVLVKTVQPDIAVMINIGPTHLRHLIDSQGVWEEKRKIFVGAEHIILHDQCSNYTSDSKQRIWRFGRKASADIQVVDQESVKIGKSKYMVPEVDYPHQLNTVAAAYGVINALGLDLPEKNQLSLLWPQARLSVIAHHSGALILNDCYNASYLSYLAALDALMYYRQKRIVVCGQMNELGHLSAHYHQLLGRVLNKMDIDMVLAYGPDSKEALSMYMGEAYYCSSMESLSLRLKEYLTEGFVVLLKGSRGLQLEQLL